MVVVVTLVTIQNGLPLSSIIVITKNINPRSTSFEVLTKRLLKGKNLNVIYCLISAEI